MLQMDGGSIEVIAVQDGVVQVRLLGTCAGCPSTVRAIIMGNRGRTARRVPEVELPGSDFRDSGKPGAFSDDGTGRSSQRRFAMVECVLPVVNIA